MPIGPPVPANIPIVPWAEENLGNWQLLYGLKDPISREAEVGSNLLVPNLELLDASESMASNGPLEKGPTKSPTAFVGEAKGLSGRLCSNSKHSCKLSSSS